ncbi:MAG: stage II sporulation protein P [Clostridia bacterium]|nr:stage II sporulation protein P [Clostridia bacterium]
MTGRKKELNPPQDIPALNPKKIKQAEAENKKKINRWYNIYLATTVCVVILTVIFLIIGFGEKSFSSSAGGSFFENAAASLLDGEFMDLSGGYPSYNQNEVKDNYNNVFDIVNGILIPSNDPDDTDSVVIPDDDAPQSPSSIYDFDYSKIPDGETAIVPMDLSLSSYGSSYIYNSTGYTPDTEALLAADFTSANNPSYISNISSPLVLIVHTHGTESYLEDKAISYLDGGGELARSENTSENVVSVGAVMSKILNENGIPTLHCTVMHDQIQYKDSYARAEETIKQYLAKYPSIKLVIDLHRDAIIKSNGDVVRPVTTVNSEATAQVMCVIGSDWGGESCPNWKNNLSLALKLRDSLNSKYENICRPTYLRSSTYNQELAPYSLLLEIGACGNSVEEAQRAAALVAAELVPLVKKM